MTDADVTAAVVAYRREGDVDARGRLIESYLPLVRGIARRFSGRGEAYEDLVQVGSLALIGAVDRCDPDRGRQLTAYICRCVDGEIRRHLRDRSGPVRIPRGEKVGDLRVPLPLEDEELASPGDLDEVGVTRALVASAARSLDGRERRIVLLRYFADLSQAEVGEVMGVSQVHVSRLLRTAIVKMRDRLEPDGIATPS